MERRDTEIVRDDVNGTVREESHVTRDVGAGGVTDSAEVVSSATPARRATEVIYLVFGIIDGLLLIRLVLKLLAANPLAGFSKFIYGLTDVFMAPFRNLLPNVGGDSGAVLEMSTVIAIIVYALIGWALVRLVAIMFFRNVTVSRRSSRGIGGPRPD
jgi:YggT family protein